MRDRIIILAAITAVFGCGDDEAGGNDAGPETTAGSSGSTTPGTSGRSGGSGTGSGSSGTGTGTAGMSTPGSGDGGAAQPPTGGSGMPPQNGGQNAYCESDEDCMDGLNCYETGRYCSTPCAQDADCASLGSDFGCGGLAGGGPGGGFPGGGGNMGQDGGGMTQPNGACRASCDGADDTSCPSGMTCLTAGGGFMGGPGGGFPGGGGDGGMTTGGAFRCGYEEQSSDPGEEPDPGMGMAAAFEACSDDDECGDGLGCTAFGGFMGGGGGDGYCAQMCMGDDDCTSMPASGSAMPSCGFGNLCMLSCAEDEDSCPDGMMCVSFGGGGGGGNAFCNFAMN